MCAAISATCGLDAIRLEIKAGMLMELASRKPRPPCLTPSVAWVHAVSVMSPPREELTELRREESCSLRSSPGTRSPFSRQLY